MTKIFADLFSGINCFGVENIGSTTPFSISGVVNSSTSKSKGKYKTKYSILFLKSASERLPIQLQLFFGHFTRLDKTFLFVALSGKIFCVKQVISINSQRQIWFTLITVI